MDEAFDRDELMERIDDDIEFLEETVEILDEDSPALLEAIRAAASAQDGDALMKPAHALKGMLGNFCAAQAVEAARKLEEMGREGQLAGVQEAVVAAESETERLRRELHDFLNEHSQ